MIISGEIDNYKKTEFEHSFRIGFSSIPKDCLSKILLEDCNEACQYYFFSVWSSEESLKAFTESADFQLLKGAFQALGKVTLMLSGNLSDYAFNHSTH